ncbi:MAG: phage minor tail protein L [Roseibium sp.]|nr:phage minor tail protein L [Roseibium sp.]
MASPTETAQLLTPDALISLFRLDTSVYGGPVLYFCQSNEVSAPIEFGGAPYQPADVEFKGMETTGTGTVPRPTVRVSNTNGAIQTIVNQYGDLLNCEFRRVRTFAKHLDGGEDPSPTTYFGPDIFKVERKTEENPLYIEWELSSSIDQEGTTLPGRRVIRDTCLWRYRVWNPDTGDFDYSRAQCPYAGGSSYDKSGNSVTSDKDQCGRRLTDCELRFGANAALPFGGFPGAARAR